MAEMTWPCVEVLFDAIPLDVQGNHQKYISQWRVENHGEV